MGNSKPAWLALDVGGANLKAAHSSGAGGSRSFALWKRPGDLANEVASLSGQLPTFDNVALTMTAELCDCFPTKCVGVIAVLDAIVEAFHGREVAVWGIDGHFHSEAATRREPHMAAASNWVALATVAARLVGTGPGLLIDVGSTTSDVIPLLDGKVAALGRTDTDRLGTGELVYAGVRRTPVCALTDRLPFRGVATGLAAELFATTLDVYLTRREVAEDPDDRDTADGRPATIEAARDRLARMVGADREGFEHVDANAFANDADRVLVGRLIEAANRSCVSRLGRPSTVVVSGSGEFLARRVGDSVIGPGGRVIGLTETWGKGASDWACARALLLLAEEERGE